MTLIEPPSSPPSGPADAAAALALLPWQSAQAMHAAAEQAWLLWARIFLSPAFSPHPHEPPAQLEIPDPIEAAPEQDLFA